MNRDKIKIVEFDLDNDEPAPSGPASDKAMKVVAFDDESSDQGKQVATAKDIGHIKIIEFDDDTKKRPPLAERPRAPARAIKIKEFDRDEPETVGPGSERAPKIKIMEFD